MRQVQKRETLIVKLEGKVYRCLKVHVHVHVHLHEHVHVHLHVKLEGKVYRCLKVSETSSSICSPRPPAPAPVMLLRRQTTRRPTHLAGRSHLSCLFTPPRFTDGRSHLSCRFTPPRFTPTSRLLDAYLTPT